jgi:hypothetical protein
MGFQQVEFEFPDEDKNTEKDTTTIEIEESSAEKIFEDKKSNKPEVDVEEDNDEVLDEANDDDDGEDEEDVEIEVIDDTPKKDRNKKPSTRPEDVTKEELENYSEKVRKRISHLSKGYHDERREKEKALRERQELEKFAQQLVEQNKKLKGSEAESQKLLLEEAKEKIDFEYNDAKRKYKEAYELGDTDKVLEAQELLTTAKIKADKLDNIKLDALQTETEPVQYQAEKDTNVTQVDEKAEAWRQENTWFNTDIEMTSYALGLHNKLINDGVDPKSDEYYETINARMRKLFPENFEDQLVEEVEKPKRRSNVVAPATRSTAPKKIRLTATQVAIAKRLGLSNKQYAEQVAIDMRKQNG